jgi:RNA polymerase sigma factor (sigma-70 family)
VGQRLRPRVQWNLGPEAFESFLSRLDKDRDEAGRRYERIRGKLINFFAWEGLVSAEILADETIDRVARKLLDGETVRALESYVFGVARRILLETRSRRRKTDEYLDDGPPLGQPPEEPSRDEEILSECLQSCLQKLPPESRHLIQTYYQENWQQQIEVRQQLAGQLGISVNALRNRALRLRNRLETCVNRCRSRLRNMKT